MSSSIRTIEQAARNIILLKSLGFLSITIVDGKSVTKFFDVLYFIFGVSFGISMCYVSIIRKHELGTSNSSIADFGNYIGFLASVIISITTMIINFIVRHRTWDFAVRLAILEDKVS